MGGAGRGRHAVSWGSMNPGDAPAHPIHPSVIDRLITAVEELRARALELEATLGDEIGRAHPDHRESARNLVHYLALRQEDIRSLQGDLASLGLSSLGRLEGHTLSTLDAVLGVLHQLAGRAYQRPDAAPSVNAPTAAMILSEHSRRLLGQRPLRRSVRIMVTMPSEAAVDYALVKRLLEAGMNVMRINCAHDGPEAWRQMVTHLRAAERELGLTCRVQVDLPGPKLRTGPLQTLARGVKLRPDKDGLGRVRKPARVWLTPSAGAEAAPGDVDATLRISGELLAASQPEDRLTVRDARRRKRVLNVLEVRGHSRIAEATRTVYLVEGSVVRLRRPGGVKVEGRVEGLPEIVEPIVLRQGETLVLTADPAPGRPAELEADGQVRRPARVHCTLPDAFSGVQPGHRAFLDDGKIGGTVTANDGREISIEVTQVADTRGTKLRAEKAINFPDTEINLPSLAESDLADQEEMASLADIVGLSFVRHPDDVERLRGHLRRLGVPSLGIVLKIERREAFENLPLLLLAALRSRPVGVMVARGDLAVEIGFERLSEVQEEILWLCEAAHVPVIWATQVLEGMAKTGSPTRAEVTDAAMSGRAECVMLNKGPRVASAVEFLSGVLERMDAHQSKKTAMLRKLSVSQNLGQGQTA